jgi:hypothetical protein
VADRDRNWLFGNGDDDGDDGSGGEAELRSAASIFHEIQSDGVMLDDPRMAIVGMKAETAPQFRGHPFYYVWETQLILPWRVNLADGTQREGRVLYFGHPHLKVVMN